MPEFEFDPVKSALNKVKHGIDFVAAQAVWDDDNLIVTEARSDTERRFMALGMIDGRLWAAFHTLRGLKIRIFRSDVQGRRTRKTMTITTVKTKSISAEELDQMFDNGEDISEYLDWSTARRPNLEPKRVNVDFPLWMVNALDREAKQIGITRQALIKSWISDKLEERKPK